MLDLVRRLEKRGPVRLHTGGAAPQRWPLRLGLVAFAGWLIYLFVFSEQGIVHLLSLRREIARVDQHSAVMAGRVKLVDEELQRIRTDPFYTEKFVRENTGMVRQGEVVYRVVAESVADEAIHARASLPPPPAPGTKGPRRPAWGDAPKTH